MSLVSLPDDVLIIIIKQLNGDIKSLYNLYNASKRVRNIMCTYGVVKRCNLTLSGIATPTALKSKFFKETSKNLKELSVRGVCHITKSILLPVVKKLHCLYKLDVTYTNITIFDFIDIYKGCNSIKDISINFIFDGYGKYENKLPKRKLLACQEVFKNMLNVHFIGNLYSIMYSHTSSYILGKSNLKTLQYTINENEHLYEVPYDSNELNFDNFIVYFLNTMVVKLSVTGNPYNSYGTVDQIPTFDMLDFSKYEIIIIKTLNYLTKPTCYASAVFENLFNTYCKSGVLEFHTLNNFNIELQGNACVMLWNKDTTKFDSKFFLELQDKLKHFFHFDVTPFTGPIVPPDYYSYLACPMPQEIENANVRRSGVKKRRVAAPSYVLDYDTAFQLNTEIQLCFDFSNEFNRSVTFSNNSEYLNKITYLSLSGHVRYDVNFFNLLFKCCNKLTTLIVDSPFISPCSSAIARSLPLSKCIKNILLIDKRINFNVLYSSMRQCKSLENVHILEKLTQTVDLADPSDMLRECVNLYCLHIYGSFSLASRKRFMHFSCQVPCNSLKHVNINIIDCKFFKCDPYIEVFGLNPINNH